MEFKLAQEQDIDRIMVLIQQAKEYLKDSGINQWQTGYPDRASIVEDIKSKNAYVMIADCEIIGYFYISYGLEDFQKEINGSWKSNLPSAAIHRLVIDNSHKGKGLSAKCFSYIETLCQENDTYSIKLDTDEDNAKMRHILEKNGYEYCGTVRFDNSNKIAFEKVLTKLG